jgi:hypothetical protein
MGRTNPIRSSSSRTDRIRPAFAGALELEGLSGPARAVIRFTDGAPDVTGLPFDEIGAAGAGVYMRRHYLERSRSHDLRFHHILKSDPGRDLHDHPWDFTALLLSGGYIEHTPAGALRYDAPCVIVRAAEDLHRLELTAPVWTLVVTGPVRRRWGFQTPTGWVPWRRYPGAGVVAGGEPLESAW